MARPGEGKTGLKCLDVINFSVLLLFGIKTQNSNIDCKLSTLLQISNIHYKLSALKLNFLIHYGVTVDSNFDVFMKEATPKSPLSEFVCIIL